MNERIKELAIEAGASLFHDLDRPNDGPLLRLKHLGIEKFAELIVRECMSVARQQRNPANLNYKPSERFVEDLRRHFGVEE